DELPIRRNGQELKPFTVNYLRDAGWQAETIVLTPEHGAPLHTDMHQIERVQSQLTERRSLSQIPAVIAIGSGTVTDVSKHACFLYEKEHGTHIPFIVMPTANSVSAYTSNTATVAGVGDLLVAFGCFADWFLAARVGHDTNYSDLPRLLIGPLDQIFFENAPDIRQATPHGTEILAKLLALEGLCQSLAHTSAPFSGFEHSISHLLDIMTEQRLVPPTLHGTQVALLTVLTTLAFQEFMCEFDPTTLDLDSCYPTADEMHARIQRAFAPLDASGSIAEECWREYKKKLDAWYAHRANFEQFIRDWGSIRAQLETIVRPPQLLVEILQRMDSPTHFEQLNPAPAEEHLRYAFINASFIRSRFTLGDLFIFLNWNMEQLWDTLWRTSRALTLSQPTTITPQPTA